MAPLYCVLVKQVPTVFEDRVSCAFVLPFVQVPVHKFAQYCHKRVERMAVTGGKKGVKKPTLEEVIVAKVCSVQLCRTLG